MKREIHLAFAFDKEFVVPFYVLLTSVFLNNKKNKLFIHSIATQVSEKEKLEITKYVVENDSEIFFYEIDIETIEKISMPESGRLPATTYHRLFFPEVLPKEIDKILYIDVDTVVIGDLSEIYNQTIYLPVAASVDSGVAGIHEFGSYFNAGVMLINIPEWKRQRITEKSVEYLYSYGEKATFYDQDALNVVLINNWHSIENKYNTTFNDIPPYLAPKSYKSFLENKIIIHYTGIDKPWSLVGRNKFRYLYYYYLQQSPKAGQTKYKDLKISPFRILIYFKIRLIEFMSNYPNLIKFCINIKKEIFSSN